MQAPFDQNPAIGAAFCRHIFMDQHSHWRSLSPLEQMESGVVPDALPWLALEQRIMTPSIVVRRTVYEKLGGFDCRLVCAEDWEMWVRIADNFRIWYEVEPLALYRMHTASNTGRHIRSGEDIRYTRLAIELFGRYLPPEMAGQIVSKAKETYARAALDMAYSMCTLHDWAAARAQFYEALACSRSIPVVQHLVWLLAKGVVGWLYKSINRNGKRV
jgi:hypothetical protein